MESLRKGQMFNRRIDTQDEAAELINHRLQEQQEAEQE